MIIKAIPTNIITGFLGVGKTTFIKQLLATKPQDEVWAVLVNEFGEVGIDASLLDNQDKGIQIREVAGGCMCCAAGVPTQVAINQLIAKAKPDRLLIEPTGLGHPSEIIKVLTASHYQNVIALQSTLCLVDARKVADHRYREHPNFMQQLQVADVIVATKTDRYETDELMQLSAYLGVLGIGARPVQTYSSVVPQSIDIMTILSTPSAKFVTPNFTVSVRQGYADSLVGPSLSLGMMFGPNDPIEMLEFNEQGFVRKHNHADDAVSCGWAFSPELAFDFDILMQQVIQAIVSANILRLKAVMITCEGIAAINWVDGEMVVTELDDAMDSRLEIIAPAALAWDEVEAQLLSAIAMEA